MLSTLVATLLTALAAGLVFYSWRRGNAPWVAAAGWLLAIGSAWPWSWALGPEIGICYAIMVYVCLVWIEVAWNMEPARAVADERQRPFQKLHRPSLAGFGRHTMIFMLSVPAAGISTLMLTAALVLLVPWAMPVKVAVTIFLFPVLWGALSVWICAQDRLLKPTVANAGILVVSSLLLFA